MKIDYNWGNPPKVHRSVARWFKRAFGHKPVPLHMSSHYNKDHFDPNRPPTLF